MTPLDAPPPEQIGNDKRPFQSIGILVVDDFAEQSDCDRARDAEIANLGKRGTRWEERMKSALGRLAAEVPLQQVQRPAKA